MPTSTKQSSGRLASVDVLRGLAATAVVLCHTAFTPKDAPWTFQLFVWAPFRYGYLGVTVFIVLSGFCIHLGIARKMAQGSAAAADWRSFWRRRFYRLYPPYVAAIAFTLCAVWAAHVLGAAASPFSGSFTWDLAAHLLMVHNLFTPYVHGLHNGPFWSLGLEEQLYLLFAVYLVLRRYRGPAVTLTVAMAVSAIWQLAVYVLQGQMGLSAGAKGGLVRAVVEFCAWDSWPFAYWFSWVLGAVAAEAYVGAIALPRWCCRYGTAVALRALGLLVNEHTTRMIAPRGTLAMMLGVQDLSPDFARSTCYRCRSLRSRRSCCSTCGCARKARAASLDAPLMFSPQ